jgi:colicin import membrane protein
VSEVLAQGTKIAEYNPTEAGLADLRHRLASVVFDVTTTKGLTEARKARAEVRTLRTSLERKRVEIKAPALAHARLIDDEAKRITRELLELETPIDEQIQAEENRKEQERVARERAEQERIARIRTLIAEMAAVPAASVGMGSARLQKNIDYLLELEVSVSTYAELHPEALSVREIAVAQLRQALTAKVADEAEQERVAAERIELARLRKAEDERQAAESKRLAEEALKLRRDRELEEERQRQARATQDEQLRKERAEHDAKMQAEREAAAERQCAEEARLKLGPPSRRSRRPHAKRRKRRRAAGVRKNGSRRNLAPH